MALRDGGRSRHAETSFIATVIERRNFSDEGGAQPAYDPRALSHECRTNLADRKMFLAGLVRNR